VNDLLFCIFYQFCNYIILSPDSFLSGLPLLPELDVGLGDECGLVRELLRRLEVAEGAHLSVKSESLPGVV
jgi:hypothetical protein